MNYETNHKSLWQREDGQCAVVLHEIFSWLSAEELCGAGACCRAWRRAAAAPPLWRNLLRARAALSTADLRALARRTVSWRQEYVQSFAGWQRHARWQVGDAPVHVALASDGQRLAVLDEDATLAIWRKVDGGWERRWSERLAALGWRGAVRAQWAASGDRLLVAGLLALVESWEMAVVRVDDDCCCRVWSRIRCSAGAAGCWADSAGNAFLSFELHVLGPSISFTTVWLNSSSQETQSEYAGVTTQIFRIFSEGSAHVTHGAVLDVPLDDAHSRYPLSDDNADAYFNATLDEPSDIKLAVLLTALGRGAGGASGADAVCVWALSERAPTPVLAASGGDLRERVRRRATAPPAQPADGPAPPPDEASVRSLCTPPEHKCALPALVIGLVPHPRGACAWVALADGGVWCLSLPGLRPLRRLGPSSPPPSLGLIHYIQPALDESYLASPAAAGRVHVWSALSCAACAADRAPSHAAPALVALLPPGPHAPLAPHALLVLAGDALYNRSRVIEKSSTEKDPYCGEGLDRVARRLAAAKAARRADYEREARAALAGCSARAPPAPTPYSLGVERECSRATDGREYSLPCAAPTGARCGPGRTPPPPRCVQLQPDDGCRISSGARFDPCAHRPRTFIEIDRSDPTPAPEAITNPLEHRESTRSFKSRILEGLGRGPRGSGKVLGRGESERGGCGSRGVHTAAVLTAAACSVADGAPPGIEGALRERAALDEAGRGRVVPMCGSPKSEVGGGGAAARLELPVPAGARMVSVRVALDAALPPTQHSYSAEGLPSAPFTEVHATSDEGKDSWLSIKNIQKKFAGCRRSSRTDSEKNVGDSRRDEKRGSAGAREQDCGCGLKRSSDKDSSGKDNNGKDSSGKGGGGKGGGGKGSGGDGAGAGPAAAAARGGGIMSALPCSAGPKSQPPERKVISPCEAKGHTTAGGLSKQKSKYIFVDTTHQYF